ncbi:M13 family metallopeptidase [Stomatohabitans albus]|uniref:M13 family metallopeptidase n=1 Tax=Stomatohabitans albus TaxID=3110766 RepID=UPI00300CB792
MFSAKIRPQDDLWGSVNSDWLADNPIPEDKASWGSFEQLRELSEEHVKTIIETSAANAVNDHEDALIAHLYDAFMDEDRIESLGLEPFHEQLAAIEAIDSLEEFITASGQQYRQGTGSVFGFYVWLDADNPDRYVPHMGQSGIGLPDKAYYLEAEHGPILEAYRSHLINMHQLVRLDGEASPWADRIITLETKIARAHWDRAKCRDAIATHNPRSVDQLRDDWPQIDLFLDAIGLPEQARERILVSQPDVVPAMAAVLTSEPLADWKAWMSWRSIRAIASLGPQAIVDEDFAFSGRIMNGTEVIRPRYKRAIGLVESYLGEPIGKRYVAKHYPERAKVQMDELITHLLDAYRESITNLDWMQASTRTKALTKLDKFTPKVGSPITWRDYSELRLDGLNLIDSVLACRGFEYAYELDRLNRPRDKNEWLMTPQTVNAYYSPLQNEIVFPAAILQPPFFDPDGDPAYNYGGIGAVIGHEIGHGFDDQGSRYDGDGVLQNWWTDADREAFEDRTASLIAQFQGLIPRALAEESESLTGVNGELTLGENIGDLGGVGIALQAWRAYVRDHGADDTIDGLTADQRFFVGWARSWRSQSRNERARQLLAVDPHSPAEFRANIVKNVDAFHEAFETTPDDAMWLEPSERVQIW